MQVILKEDVINLGYKDDIVTVKDGYGRNFLIPQRKAVIASESAKKMLAEDKKQRAHKLAKIKEEAEALAAQLKDVTLTIGAKIRIRLPWYNFSTSATIASWVRRVTGLPQTGQCGTPTRANNKRK